VPVFAAVVATLLRFRAGACVVLACIAALLCATTSASALERVQSKTRVWDFSFAEPLNSYPNALASPRLHPENQLARAKHASGSPHAARGGTGIKTALEGLRAGKNAGVRVVDSADELQSLFGRLSSGGKVVEGSSYPGKLVELGDKTTVGLRAASKSEGPTIDIKLPGGELWKVHVQ
jgi:hypothetical protein